MKTQKVTFWIVAIILAILPAIIGFVYPQLLVDHYKELINTYGGLMTLCVLGTWFLNGESYFLQVQYKAPGESTTTRTNYNVVPWVAIIYLIDILAIFIGKPDFINAHFSEVIKIISSIIVTVVIYGIFNGEYNPIETKKTTKA